MLLSVCVRLRDLRLGLFGHILRPSIAVHVTGRSYERTTKPHGSWIWIRPNLFAAQRSFGALRKKIVGPHLFFGRAALRHACQAAERGGRLSERMSLAASAQSGGALAIPHTFPWVYSDAPTKKYLPSLPNGTQLATCAVTLPPPGKLLIMMGVPACNSSEPRKPHPCALTTSNKQRSPNGLCRSRLITLTGISTRSRVLRRVALAV